MTRTPRTVLVTAVAALAVAVGAGAATAHGGPGGPGGPGGGGLKGLAASLEARSAVDADVARRLGTTVAKLNDAIASAVKAQVAAAREDDEITADEAETLKNAIDDGTLRAHGLGRASEVAKALGTTTAKLNEAYREARRAQLLARVDQAVKDGDLEADEAARLKNRLQNADLPGYSAGRGFGPGLLLGPGGGFGKHRLGR